MKIKEHIAGKVGEFKDEMRDTISDIQKNKGKVLGALIGLGIFGVVANQHDSMKEAQWHQKIAHEQDIKYERERQSLEEAEWRQIDKEKRADQGMKTPE